MSYDLTQSEERQYQEIKDSIALHGGLFQMDRDGMLVMDNANAPIPVEFIALRTRRFIVDPNGVLWRFAPEGSPKNPADPTGGGSPWRQNRVEMWTGKWHKLDGSYAKSLRWVALDKRVNGHPALTQIEWYKSVKRFKHPFDEPHAPDKRTIAALEGRRVQNNAAIMAKLEDLTEITNAGQEHGGQDDSGTREDGGDAAASKPQPAGKGGNPKASRTNGAKS